MANLNEFFDGLSQLQQGTIYAQWAKSNPKEAQAFQSYLAAVKNGKSMTQPAMKTTTGQALVKLVHAVQGDRRALVTFAEMEAPGA